MISYLDFIKIIENFKNNKPEEKKEGFIFKLNFKISQSIEIDLLKIPEKTSPYKYNSSEKKDYFGAGHSYSYQTNMKNSASNFYHCKSL